MVIGSSTCPNGRLTENVFKRIFANYNPNPIPNPNSNPNPKAQNRLRENKMTSFFGQVSKYGGNFEQACWVAGTWLWIRN